MGIKSAVKNVFKKKPSPGAILVSPDEVSQIKTSGQLIQVVGGTTQGTTSGGTAVTSTNSYNVPTGNIDSFPKPPPSGGDGKRKSGSGDSSYVPPTVIPVPSKDLSRKQDVASQLASNKLDTTTSQGRKQQADVYTKSGLDKFGRTQSYYDEIKRQQDASKVASRQQQYYQSQVDTGAMGFEEANIGLQNVLNVYSEDVYNRKLESEKKYRKEESERVYEIDMLQGSLTESKSKYGGTKIDYGKKEQIDILTPNTIYSFQTGTYKGTPLIQTNVIGEDWSSRPATREEINILSPMTEEAVGGGAYTSTGEYLYSGSVSSPLNWKGVLGEKGKKVKIWASQELPLLNKVESKIETWELKEGRVLTKVDKQFLGGTARGIIPSTKGELLIMGGTTALGFGVGGVTASLGIGGKGIASKIIGGGMLGAYGIGTGIKMKVEPDISKKGEIFGRSARDFGLFAYGYKGGFKTFVPRTEIIPLREGKIPTFKEEIYNVVSNDKLFRVGKYEINVEQQPPRIKYTTNRFRDYFGLKPLEIKYLPKVTSKVKTPFNVINEDPFTILEQKPRGKVGKVGMIEGQSNEFTLQTDIYSASKIDKYLVRGLGEYKTGGTPLPSSTKELVSFFDKNNMRFLSDIQSTKYFKMNIGKKPMEVNLEPLGKRTSRFRVLTEVTPIKETDVFSLSRADMVFKDITFPFARASGKTPAMKGVTLEWLEPIILEGGKTDVTFIKTGGGKKTPFSDTFKEQFQKQIQEKKYAPTKKPPVRTPPTRIVNQELQPSKLVSQIASPSLVSVQRSFSQQNLGSQISRTPFMERDISANAYNNKEISINLYKNLGKEINKNLSKNISKELNKSLNINIAKNINKEMNKEIQKNVQKQMQKTIQKQIQKTTQKNTLRTMLLRRFTNKTSPPFLFPRRIKQKIKSKSKRKLTEQERYSPSFTASFLKIKSSKDILGDPLKGGFRIRGIIQ